MLLLFFMEMCTVGATRGAYNEKNKKSPKRTTIRRVEGIDEH